MKGMLVCLGTESINKENNPVYETDFISHDYYMVHAYTSDFGDMLAKKMLWRCKRWKIINNRTIGNCVRGRSINFSQPQTRF